MIKQQIKSFTMNYSDESTSFKCSVPCSVYSTLADNGVIGHPYEIKDISELSGYTTRAVTFVSTFRVDECVFVKANIDLCISMLDTVAKIRLNGRKIADVSNCYLTYNFNVKNILNSGENTLEIEILPPTASCRKPRYMYGTQFSPRLLDMGIYGEVSLVAYDSGYINNIVVKQEHKDESVKLCIEVDTVGDIRGKYAVATVESPGGKVYFGALNNGKGYIDITAPNLWWPRGMGPQNLYRVSVNLYSDSEIVDTKEVKVGLKAVSCETSESGKIAMRFNGEPYFACGATVVPADSVIPFSSSERVRKILKSVADANCNTVRVSALGYYMPDYFYNYCDELGLVVWQDLMVVGNIADGIDEAGISREIKENVLRLSHHACVALVVGAIDEERRCLPPSEMDNHSFIDLYHAFYDNIARKIVKEFEIEYSIALPDSFRDGYCSDNSLAYVADGMSIVSLPDKKTLGAIDKSENINMLSPVLEAHQLSRADNLTFIMHSLNKYLYPMTVDTLIYATQQSAAEEIKQIVCKARRDNYKCGVFISRANDSWYGISQSTVDYFGRWKAGNYMLKRELSPVLVMAEEVDGEIVFSVSNNTSEDFSATLHYAVVDNRNIPIFAETIQVSIGEFKVQEVLRKNLASIYSGREDECYSLFYLLKNDNIVSKSTLMFTKRGEKTPVNQKSFRLLKPNVEGNIVGSNCDFVFTYSADVYVKNLEISFDTVDCIFDDNFFDVTDTLTHRVHFKTLAPATAAKLSEELRLKSAYDVGR